MLLRRLEFETNCSSDMASIQNVIFDWSGTLVNDLRAVWRATNYTLIKAGRSKMTLEEFRAEFSLPFDEFYDRVTPGVPLEQLEEWFPQFTKGNSPSVRVGFSGSETQAHLESNLENL